MLYVPMDSELAPMSTFWQEVVVSSASGMAGVGALIAARLSDAYGRRRLILASSALFSAGALICAVGYSKWILLIGRLLLGFAIGLASMVVPIYVGESSPANIRGRLVSGFVLMITFGQMASNLVAEALSYLDPVRIGWRLMFALAAVPAIIQLIGFLRLPESPRWLYTHPDRRGECEQVLRKVYNGDEKWMRYELEEIRRAHDEQMAAGEGGAGQDSLFEMLSRIFRTQPVRRALFLGCLVQAFQQISGINTIMYYTGSIIRSAGVADYHTVIWISVLTAGVNFVCTLVPMYLVERLGRRPLLIASMLGTVVTLCLMGGAFFLINHDSLHTTAPSVGFDAPIERCSAYSNCDYCVTDEQCGFCPLIPVAGNGVPSGGICVSRNLDDANTLPQCFVLAERLGILNATNSIGLTLRADTEMETSCHTKYTALPILIMLLYLACYSIGEYGGRGVR